MKKVLWCEYSKSKCSSVVEAFLIQCRDVGFNWFDCEKVGFLKRVSLYEEFTPVHICGTKKD